MREDGLYILPQPLPYPSGRLISVTTNGFYNTLEQKNTIVFVLYWQLLNGSYYQAYSIISDPINITGDANRTITLHVNIAVMTCDLIGLVNNRDCRVYACFLPSIQSNSTNDTLLHSSTLKFSDQAVWSGVYLNVQALITGKTNYSCCCG